jgi:hypothetical protein
MEFSAKRRLSIVALLSIAALVIATATAFAGGQKSNSQSASSVYVNQTGSCDDLQDNLITGDTIRVIVKSSEADFDPEELTWELLDKGAVVAEGDLDFLGICGDVYYVMTLDWNANEDPGDDGADLQGDFDGSHTLRVYNQDGTNFSSDSFRFG